MNMHAEPKTKAWVILLSALFGGTLLLILNNNFPKITEAIKTPPVTEEQLATTVADHNKAQLAQIESLKNETHELKVELAAAKSTSFLQSKRLEDLANTIGTLRADVEKLTKQMEVAQTNKAKNDPTTHPLVASQLQNKKPASGTFNAEMAKSISKGHAASGDPITTEKKHAPSASPLTPDEQTKLSRLKKSVLFEKLAAKNTAKENTKTPNAGFMKQLKGQLNKPVNKSFSDSLQTLKKVLQNKEIKRPGK